MAKGIKLTTEQFIEKARSIHGDKYDYSKTVYTHSHSKVTIICPIHGEFQTRPSKHAGGTKTNCSGCPKCSTNKLTKQEFVSKANKKHNNKYDYSKTVYEYANKKVCITCPVEGHGDFYVTPNAHIHPNQISGCTKCTKKYRRTNKEYIKEAMNRHNNKYDYSKTIFKNMKLDVIITCHDHGDFVQNAQAHLRGHGCPECGKNQVSEPLFREVLEKIFVDKFNKEYKFPNTRPEWLRNPETEYPLELDCYNEELELAFELQGTQHYEPIDYFGGESYYYKQYRHDLRKQNICRHREVSLYCIDNRPVEKHKEPVVKQQYYEQEILKCLAKVPEKIKIKLLEGFDSQQ